MSARFIGSIVVVFALVVGSNPAPAQAGLILGGFAVTPTQLPSGFTPYGSVKDSTGAYVVGGEYQGKPAYVTVTPAIGLPALVSPVQVLNSLSVQAGGTDPRGRVSDVVLTSTGQVQFIGSSKSPNSPPNLGGEGTVWSMSTGTGQGTGFLPGMTPSSLLVAGSSSGVSVGGSTLTPIMLSSSGLSALPTGGMGGAALSVSQDGSVIGGATLSGGAAYWTRQPDGSYQLHNVEMPGSTLSLDSANIRGSEGSWLSGSFSDIYSGNDVAGLWNSLDGRMLHDFSTLGGIDPQFMRVGMFENTHVASINFLDPTLGPALFIEGEQGLVPLSSLLGSTSILGTDGRIVDLFSGSLGVVFQGRDDLGNSAFYITSWETNPATPTPEPSSLLLMTVGAGTAALAARRRKRLQDARASV